jgi:hypothetical protein
MDKESFHLHDQDSLAKVMGYLSGLRPTRDKPYTVTISQENEARSVKQNRLAFLWYRIRGSMTGHGAEYERATCKLLYGVPILREDKAFDDFYMTAIHTLSYKQMLDAMEYVPVTRLMTTKQFALYLDTIDQESANIGIVLPQPEDLYWDALMKEADHRG